MPAAELSSCHIVHISSREACTDRVNHYNYGSIGYDLDLRRSSSRPCEGMIKSSCQLPAPRPVLTKSGNVLALNARPPTPSFNRVPPRTECHYHHNITAVSCLTSSEHPASLGRSSLQGRTGSSLLLLQLISRKESKTTDRRDGQRQHRNSWP